jgi:hypothetical protein
MLDFVDETLNQMPLTIKPGVVGSLLSCARMRGNDCFCTTVHNLINEVLSGIASVSYQALKDEPINQVASLGDVVTLPAGQGETQRVSQRVGTYMDFGAEPTSAASECLRFLSTVFFGAPAAQGWARTTVLSNIKFSMSGSSAKWACMRSQTPLSHQRAKRLYTVFQLPYASGNKRHWAPLRVTQSTPSKKRRQSVSFPTYKSGHVRRKLSIFDHCFSGRFTFMGSYCALLSLNVNRT